MAENGRDYLPLRDAVLCSTSLPQDARIRLADVAEQMGAAHKLDLTGEVTHLIVGDTDTPKYKYVAKERPDIVVLDPTWIDAIREAWMDGDDVDVKALERIHRCPTFAGLKICITGVSDQTQRNLLSSKIQHEGAEYHGDLTKQVTHLLVARPEGAKYKAALDWRINTVSMKWLEDSITRGMALDPKYYDPTMPSKEQGEGAYRKEAGTRTSLGKRVRNEESQTSSASGNGKRKLRRHASRRLEDHSQDMWQDISAVDTSMVVPPEVDQWTAGDEDSQHALGRSVAQPQNAKLQQEHTETAAPRPEGLFSGWFIAMQGFEKEKTKRLAQYLEPNGAHMVAGLQDLESIEATQLGDKRCLLVPHAQNSQSTHVPCPSPGITVATEWWVERCIHHKQVLDPESDVLSQPLWNLNILGFSKMTVSTTGFSGVDYRQVAESIKLAGATYQEQLGPTVSVLLSGTTTVKKEKAYYAAKHRIPVVTAEWLWTCFRSKRKASMDRFRIELPKYDSNYVTGHGSAAPSPVPSDIRQKTDGDSKKDNQTLSRLSHSRKRQTTPSLLLHSRKYNDEHSKPAGPFVHEDEEDDDDDHDDNDLAVPVEIDGNKADDGAHADIAPLRTISPNASPRKMPVVAKGDTTTTPTENGDASTLIHPEANTELHTNDEESGVSPVDERPSAGPQPDWTANLASLVEKQQRRTASSEHHTPAQRLKHRKLGRAASGSSLANRTNSGSMTVNQELSHGDTSFSKSPDSLSTAQEDLPGTQIGYETLEAEAARLQMAKRMGTSYSDETAGTRLASLGTVRDSAASAAAAGTRARNRTRKQ